jgi:hypothetical protein
VQRGVDAGGARVQVEGAVRQVGHHLVFDAPGRGSALQRLQLVHVQGRETVQLDAAQVAAGALHPQHLDLLAAQRIGHHHLGGGIAAAEIGNAQVRPEQVGTVQQQFRFAHGGGDRIVPDAT